MHWLVFCCCDKISERIILKEENLYLTHSFKGFSSGFLSLATVICGATVHHGRSVVPQNPVHAMAATNKDRNVRGLGS